MMRRPRKRFGSFYKLTAALRRLWQKGSGNNSAAVSSRSVSCGEAKLWQRRE